MPADMRVYVEAVHVNTEDTDQWSCHEYPVVPVPGTTLRIVVKRGQEELLALKMADRLCKEALPKFNWGASALDANAIKLLNEVPGLISAAIQRDEMRDAQTSDAREAELLRLVCVHDGGGERGAHTRKRYSGCAGSL